MVLEEISHSWKLLFGSQFEDNCSRQSRFFFLFSSSSFRLLASKQCFLFCRFSCYTDEFLEESCFLWLFVCLLTYK